MASFLTSWRSLSKFFLYPSETVRRSIHERRSLMVPVIFACVISAVDGSLGTVGLLSFLSINPVFRIWFNSNFGTADLVLLVGLIACVAVFIFGILSSVVVNSIAKALGARGLLGEAIRAEFYGVLPYSFVAIPLALSILSPTVFLITAIMFFVGALIWQFYILTESFKEIYGFSSTRSFAISISPAIIPITMLLIVELVTSIKF